MSLGGFGPWFLDRQALAELDALFEKIELQVVAEQEAAITKEADTLRATLGEPSAEVDERVTAFLQKRRGSIKRPERTLKIAFGKTTRVVAKSFTLARDACAKHDAVPTAFDYAIAECGTLKLDDDLLRVEPDHANWGGIFVDTLRNWIEEHRPSWPKKIWRVARALTQINGGPVAVIVGIAVATLIADPTDASAKDRARELLKGGVTTAELPDAVETLLRLQVHEPVTPTSILPRLLWVVGVVGGLLLAVIVGPKGVVGVSAKADRVLKNGLLRWRIVSISLPGLVLTTIIGKLIERVFFTR